MGRVRKRILAAVLAACLAVMPAATVSAVEGVADVDPAVQRETERQTAYAIAPDTNSLAGWPQGPSVYGDSAIVMDMNSGAIVYGKQIDKTHYPASITKILTALVALENSELTDEVLFSEDSISFLEYGDAHIGMTPGEILSMEDALYGMLLASANEVAYAIAENVGKLMGGDYNTFIQKMNERSAELGCTGSHWTNPNGLHDDNHYTTAHDMALIASAVYQYDEFRTIVQTLSYTIPPTNLVNESRTFQQKHKMLWPENANYYQYCTGGKTGYTDQARTTLVTMADNGELRLAAVVLYDFGNDAYVDTRAMFDYVFDNFSKVVLSGQEKPEEIDSYADNDAYVLLPAGIGFEDLDKEIEITDEQNREGTVTYTYQGQNVGSADVVLAKDYVAEKTGHDYTLQAEKGSQVSGEGAQADEPSAAVKIAAGIGSAAIVFVILLAVHIWQARRKKRLLRRRRRARNTGKVRSVQNDEYGGPDQNR